MYSEVYVCIRLLSCW